MEALRLHDSRLNAAQRYTLAGFAVLFWLTLSVSYGAPGQMAPTPEALKPPLPTAPVAVEAKKEPVKPVSKPASKPAAKAATIKILDVKPVSAAKPVAAKKAFNIPIEQHTPKTPPVVPQVPASAAFPEDPIMDVATPDFDTLEPTKAQETTVPAAAVETQPVEAAPLPKSDFSETENLDKLYKEQSPFNSAAYLFKVFGILAVLLGAFYVVARIVMLRMQEGGNSDPLIPFQKTTTTQMPSNPMTPLADKKSLWASLLQPGTGLDRRLQTRVLSRTRLAPGKEIHIVEIGNRQLVIGSTPQQMTLLTELPETNTDSSVATAGITSSSFSASDAQAVKDVYKKYLTKPVPVATNKARHPELQPTPADREVFVLEDYEDQF